MATEKPKPTIERLDPTTDGASANILKENIERLKELFPEIVTEGKIDFEALKETLGDDVDDRPERYSFTWHGKSRARRIAQTPSTGSYALVLRSLSTGRRLKISSLRATIWKF